MSASDPNVQVLGTAAAASEPPVEKIKNFTMNFGPLPMYVLAPMKTAPHEIAARSDAASGPSARN